MTGEQILVSIATLLVGALAGSVLRGMDRVDRSVLIVLLLLCGWATARVFSGS